MSTTSAKAKQDDTGITEQDVPRLLSDLDAVWEELYTAEQARIMQLLVASGSSDPHGVRYRKPQLAILTVCNRNCSRNSQGKVTPRPDELISQVNTAVAQWGRPMFVELTNRLFEKNNFSLTFAPNGSLNSMEFGSESSLAKATGALSDTATQVQGLLDAERQANKAAAEEEAHRAWWLALAIKLHPATIALSRPR